MTATSAPAAATAAVGVRTRGRAWRRYRARTFYAFAAPWIIGFLLLTLAPIGYTFVVSLTSYDGQSSFWRWVGFQNYVEMFTRDPAVWQSLTRTLLYTALAVPLSVAGALVLALLVNQRIRARGVVRSVFFLPSVVPVVATAIMWRLIFGDTGLLNGILGLVGGSQEIWLVDPYAFYALIVMTLWTLGGGMIIILAALQDVPPELLDAARIDGAGSLRVIRHITIPIISPILYFNVITGVIVSLQMLVQPMLLAQTNTMAQSTQVPTSTTLYMVNVYQQFFIAHRFGYGCAMLWVFFVVILASTLLLQRMSRRFIFYQVAADEN